MAVYAVGDIQGCLDPLKRLLDMVQFNPAEDQIWFVGDLVNRGPNSLGTLRYVKELGDVAKVVLGNHDLHLLALAEGVKKVRNHPTLDSVLTAPDRDELMFWLRHQPLVYRDPELHVVLVHAGIHPDWRIKQAEKYSKEVEAILQSDRYPELLEKMYGRKPYRWHPKLKGWARYRFIINACTRMRYLKPKMQLDFNSSVPPGKQSRRLTPWYETPMIPRKNWRIVYGHWSSAGHWFDGNHIALDTGCVWGEKMMLARIDQRLITTHKVKCG